VPDVPLAQALLALGSLHDATAAGEREMPLDVLRGRAVVAVAAVGNPGAFVRQLRQAGAEPRPAIFADHYQFTPEDARRLAAGVRDGEVAVCTLKDAVKLAPLWPRGGPPLWYVSQTVVIEHGGDAIAAVLDAVLRASHRQP
jgi:tetraacyldisaccharide 4'-kinase